VRPYSDIQIGDVYKSSSIMENTYMVVNKNDEEKMIELRCSYQNPHLPETIWRKNTDRIFNIRVLPMHRNTKEE
jgi:hypothetical protein